MGLALTVTVTRPSSRFEICMSRPNQSDYLVDNASVGNKLNSFRPVAVHIRHCGRKSLVVNSAFISRNRADRHSRGFRYAHICYTVKTVKNHIAPIFAVSHKVITLIVKYHLIRAYHLIRGFVQLFIRFVFVIIIA